MDQHPGFRPVSGFPSKLEFQLDDSPFHPLSWGTDLHRLALPGDFNVELDFESVSTGTHQITVQATYEDGAVSTGKMTFEKKDGGPWKLPYAIDFKKVKHLQDVVQVVDGHWKKWIRITDGGSCMKDPSPGRSRLK